MACYQYVLFAVCAACVMDVIGQWRDGGTQLRGGGAQMRGGAGAGAGQWGGGGAQLRGGAGQWGGGGSPWGRGVGQWRRGGAQWGGGGGAGQWGGGGGLFQRGFPNMFPVPQNNALQAAKANCKSQDGVGNVLEVIITPQDQPPFPGWFPQQTSNYIIDVHVDSVDIDAEFTVVVTELSTDNAICSQQDLGLVINNGQSQNRGFFGLFGQFGNAPTSAGILGIITIEPNKINDLEVFNNRAYNSFEEFRGRGIGICTNVDSVDNTQQSMFLTTPSRQTCEFPVLCCKLGLSADSGGSK